MDETNATNRYGGMCAEIYNLDKPPGALFDIRYYRERLAGLPGPVLEAACGSGRLLIPLLEAGIETWGFDHSQAMLDLARENAAGRGLTARLDHAGFHDFAYDRPFPAIVVAVGSFILIDDFHAALEALSRFRAHLEPGGLLLVDLPVSEDMRAPSPPRTWTAANGDLLRLERQSASADPVGQRYVEHHRYERWRAGRLIESELELFAYRTWGMREFELALAARGFLDIAVSADYRHGRTPGAGTRMLNFSARAG